VEGQRNILFHEGLLFLGAEDHRMDVVAWLRGLGLERYAPAFRDNDIDGDLLRRLTAEDLRELGVTSVGHRRRLLDAIAAFDASTPVADTSGLAAETIATLALAPADAERRQLTVMFCDLVGSTALSARLDPEDLREVIGAYHRTVDRVVAGLDGFVAKYMGDGVLVYFGYPQAHEDDAERAVRAGLGVIESVGRLDFKSVELQARVGIATGLVVVGDLIGKGSAQEQSVVGETPNLAARLQALAEPDAVVIAAGTRRLVGDLFEYRDLGAVEVKGIVVPVPAWQVLRPSAVASRFEALRGSALTRLVGRDEEIELLVRRWARAKAGDSHIVLLSGEPGIGKSRIVAALQEQLRGEPHTRIRYFCSPQHQNSALYPVIRQLEHAAGFERDDPLEIKLDKLEALLGAAAAVECDIALVAELLSLDGGGRYPPLDLSPQRKRDLTSEALLRQLENLAQQQPVLLLFEDLHWIDPTSRALLDRIIERVEGLPVLLIATFRPEFQPPWIGQPQVTVMALNRLDRNEMAALVRQLVVGNKTPLPQDIIEEIIERTDGVPLFAEELTKAVLEAGDCAPTTVSSVPPPSLAVPTTLYASLMARLDRLGPVPKELAQIGAAIGREFPLDLMARVASRDQNELQTALDRLLDAGLVFQRGAHPQALFLFKHALIQETAYQSLLKSTRQQYHQQIAQVLIDYFPETVQTQPELLAHHYTEAGLLERSVIYWQKAGQHASQRSAHIEAATHLTRGLKVIALLPDTSERAQYELALQTTLGPVLMATKGYASADVGQAYRRARELCHLIGETPQLFQVLLGLRFFYQVGGGLQNARELGEQLLELAQNMQSRTFLTQAHTMLGHTLCCLGEFASAREHLEQAMALYDPQQHRTHILLSGLDPGVFCRCAGAWSLWHLGYPDQALERAQAALALASELSHPQSLDQALCSIAQVHQYRREEDATRDQAERAIAVSTERGFQMRVAMATVLRGWALAIQEEGTEGITQLRQGLASNRATGAAAFVAYYLALLAER
jgi:class 3 adenylate cyclase/tetratricopeptide (TPR) repeat protein